MGRQKIHPSAILLYFVFITLVFLVNFRSAFGAERRVLRIGDLGEDVRELQKLLNSSVIGPIVSVGPGSRGKETAFFGAKTEAAVRAYQSHYKSEILVPVGLNNPTGVVGPMTWKMLIGVQAPAPSSIKPNNPISPTPQYDAGVSGDSSARDLNAATDVVLSYISPERGGPGTTVVLHGSGFAPAGNTVYAGYTVFSNVPSPDGKTISIRIDPGYPSFGDKALAIPLWIYVESGATKTSPQIFSYTANYE